jgi:hypothetical protein
MKFTVKSTCESSPENTGKLDPIAMTSALRPSDKMKATDFTEAPELV